MNTIYNWLRTSPLYSAVFVQYFSLGVAFTVLLLWLISQASGFFTLIVSLLILVALSGVTGWVFFRILINRSTKIAETPSASFRAYLIQIRDDLGERNQWLIRILNVAIDYWKPIKFVSSILLMIWVFGKLIGLADLMISSVNLESVQQQIELTEQQAEAATENAKLQARLEIAELNARIRPLELIVGDWTSLGFLNEAGEAVDYLSQFHCGADGQISHDCEVAARYQGEERVLFYYALAFKDASLHRQRNSSYWGEPYSEGLLGVSANALEDFDGQIFFQGLIRECFAPERLNEISLTAFNDIQETERRFSSLLSYNDAGILQRLDNNAVSSFNVAVSGLDEDGLVNIHREYIRDVNIMVAAYGFCYDRLNELLGIRDGFQTEHSIVDIPELSFRTYIQTESYEVDPLAAMPEPPQRNLSPEEKELIDSGFFE